MSAALVTEPRIEAPDVVYFELTKALEGLDDEQAERLLFRLVFLLSNQIGRYEVLSACIRAARQESERVQEESDRV